ncbi:hypothetical protein G6F23_014509 [Rhizopus arrhizus]|nr:hypothetical protein G6F23_014509 [Rhizopus arrhizus]
MDSNTAQQSAETESWFTRGVDGNSPSVSARIAARDARRFEAWVERRRARDARELLEEEAIQWPSKLVACFHILPIHVADYFIS